MAPGVWLLSPPSQPLSQCCASHRAVHSPKAEITWWILAVRNAGNPAWCVAGERQVSPCHWQHFSSALQLAVTRHWCHHCTVSSKRPRHVLQCWAVQWASWLHHMFAREQRQSWVYFVLLGKSLWVYRVICPFTQEYSSHPGLLLPCWGWAGLHSREAPAVSLFSCSLFHLCPTVAVSCSPLQHLFQWLFFQSRNEGNRTPLLGALPVSPRHFPMPVSCHAPRSLFHRAHSKPIHKPWQGLGLRLISQLAPQRRGQPWGCGDVQAFLINRRGYKLDSGLNQTSNSKQFWNEAQDWIDLKAWLGSYCEKEPELSTMSTFGAGLSWTF